MITRRQILKSTLAPMIVRSVVLGAGKHRHRVCHE
jgi:hypothetical protein